MATISSPGIGSGLDVNSMVAQLMAVERKPMEQVQARQQQVNSQVSAYGKLSSAMSALQQKATALTRDAPWNATQATSSQPTVVRAETASGGSAASGVYNVSVSQLATAQTLVTSKTWAASTAKLGSGTITVEFGTWNAAQTSFTGSGSPETITIDSGADSVEQVRDAINAAAKGITASLVQDASGTRLMLRADETGKAQGFRITVNDDNPPHTDDKGLSALVFSTSTKQMAQTRAAGNALANIDGVAIESPSNVLDGSFEGLSLTLLQTTASPVQVTVTRDRTVARTAILDFAKAYNDLMALLREQTRVGAPGTASGVLKGDSAATGLMASLRSLSATTTTASSALQRLTEVGLEPQKDGSLRIDESKLDAALSQFAAMQQLFARDAAGTASDGLATLFKDFAGTTLATDGTLDARQDALRARLDSYQDRLERLEDRLARTEKRLLAQYTRLDSSLSSLKSLQSYVEQQVNSWNAQKG